jgi:PAS domain S-box-containing protein
VRQKIFFRLLALLALLIACAAIAMTAYEVLLNRQQHRDQARGKTRILARQLSQLLLWDDRVAVRDLLDTAVAADPLIRYAFIERKDGFYAHTFRSGVPTDLLGTHNGAHALIDRTIRNTTGTVLYDIVSRIEPTGDILHLGFDRDAIDRKSLPVIADIFSISLFFLVLLIYPAWIVSATITHEIDLTTGKLIEVNETLEARVMDRTAALADMNKRVGEEREWLAVTLRSIGDGVITTDMTGRITLFNPVAEGLTGWKQEEVLGRVLADVFNIVNQGNREKLENPVDRVLRSGSMVGLANHTLLISKDGSERVIADSGAPIRDSVGHIIGVVLVFRDVTDKERLEVELQRSEKLDSIGVLAGGIAHDFNNLLAAILGNLNLAQLEVPPSASTQSLLENAEKATLRAKDLAFRLLTFAKGSEPVKTTCSIEEIARDAARFALSGSKSICRFVFEPNLPAVEIDAGQISQVIHNLLLNADQAMTNGGGEIILRGEAVVVGRREDLPLAPGHYVCIRVEDHGSGIPESHLIKLFDPYFTTKPHGSGLGLTVAHSIIKNHNGHFTVTSQLGKGTTFSFYLPASGGVPRKPDEKQPAIGDGKGLILVMDDEEAVRDVLQGMLAKIGYTIECAAHGEEAMAKCLSARAQSQPFDLLFFDLTIRGGMGGVEALRRIRQEGILTPAIASSGYSLDPVMANPRAYGFSAAVPKPYNLGELSRVTRQVMGRGETTST